MIFADIHCHALYGVDDGAPDAAHMCAMLDAAYADGVRFLCLTPHCHPGYYGDNRGGVARAFSELVSYAAQHYPDLTLALGNELHYAATATEWLRSGVCRTMNGTHFVLVDFSSDAPRLNIIEGVRRLLGGGYQPILAHVERYRHLTLADVQMLRSLGVHLQINAGSLVGIYGFSAKHTSRRLVRRRMVDFVGSDGHNTKTRPMGMSEGYAYIAAHTDRAFADAVCLETARDRLFSPEAQKTFPPDKEE